MQDRRPLGILLFLAAILCQCAMDATAKWLTQSYPVGQVLFLRNLFGFLPLIPLFLPALRTRDFSPLKTNRLGMHAARGLATTTAGLLFFMSLSFLPLATATAITYTGPIFMTVLAALLLSERADKWQWAAVVIGFLGALLIIRPEAGSLQWAALLPLGCAASYALSMVLFRGLAATESTLATTLYGGLAALLGSSLLLPLGWVTPSLEDMAIFVAIGLFGGTTIVLFAQAYRFVDVATTAPLDYTSLLWAALFGLWIFGEAFDFGMVPGVILLILAGLYLIRRDNAAG